nr:MAG TPA: hypothetical protein [Caudoviricetes sp.]
MADKLVFSGDIDNATIKIVNNQLTVETADELEIIAQEPDYGVDDDEYYVDTEWLLMLHKPTNATFNVNRTQRKKRDPERDEELVNYPEFVSASLINSGTQIRYVLEHNMVESAVDHEQLYLSNAFDGVDEVVEFNKSDYENANAFNTAIEGKYLPITSKPRFSSAAGKPKLRATEIRVPLKKLPWLTTDVEPVVSWGGNNTLNFKDYAIFSGDAGDVFESTVAANNNTVKCHYSFTFSDNTTIEGDYDFNVSSFDLNLLNISDYAEAVNAGKQLTHIWVRFDPFKFDSFYGKFTISLKDYELVNLI